MTTAPQRPGPASRFPDSDDFAKGPVVGEPLPDFTLPDQHRRPVNLTAERAGRPALLAFIRSADW